MKTKEEILKEFDERFNWEEIFGKNSKAQQSLRELFIKALAQTREETIREVEEEIKSWENEDGKSFTSDKIKNILNKLKK